MDPVHSDEKISEPLVAPSTETEEALCKYLTHFEQQHVGPSRQLDFLMFSLKMCVKHIRTLAPEFYKTELPHVLEDKLKSIIKYDTSDPNKVEGFHKCHHELEFMLQHKIDQLRNIQPGASVIRKSSCVAMGVEMRVIPLKILDPLTLRKKAVSQIAMNTNFDLVSLSLMVDGQIDPSLAHRVKRLKSDFNKEVKALSNEPNKVIDVLRKTRESMKSIHKEFKDKYQDHKVFKCGGRSLNGEEEEEEEEEEELEDEMEEEEEDESEDFEFDDFGGENLEEEVEEKIADYIISETESHERSMKAVAAQADISDEEDSTNEYNEQESEELDKWRYEDCLVRLLDRDDCPLSCVQEKTVE